MAAIDASISAFISDPRAALTRSLGQQIAGLIGQPVTANRLVNPPPFPGHSLVFALFSAADGTTAAIALLDLPGACLLGSALTGENAPALADIETAGRLPATFDDAVNEVCNVLAALFNSLQPHRVRLTGVMLAPIDTDTSEAPGTRLDVLVALTGVGSVRMTLCGPAVDAAAITVSAAETATRGCGFAELAPVLTPILMGFCGRPITLTPGTTLALTKDLRASLGVYATSDNQPCLVIVADLSLSAYLGAAPMIIPRAVALEQIKLGRLEGTLLDGLQETYNILAAPFARRRHVRLTGLHWLPGVLPPLVGPLLPTTGTLPAYTVEVQDYGIGKLALAGSLLL